MTHDYLEALAGLADERPVVFYDQLGSGNSDRPDDPSLWHVQRFVAELAAVRAVLGYPRLHLFGHSWGSIMAAEYALTRPVGLVSVVFAGPALSYPRYAAGAAALRADLPIAVQQTLDRHEAAGTTASEEYEAATVEYYQRNLGPMDPPPEALRRSLAVMGQQVYATMQGPNEFVVTGNLKNYDCTDRLGELSLPTLFTCGRADIVRPEEAEYYHRLAPGSELVIFEQSRHAPHMEESEHYVTVLRDFLRRAESR
jgi:proline iminopeptidase